MKIIINGVEFENTDWSVTGVLGRMTVQTDETIPEILETIGDGQDIYVYDNDDVLSSKWCNKGIQGIDRNDGMITVTFVVSILDENAEVQLQNGIDESVDAILELGELLDTMDSKIAEQKDNLNEQKEALLNQKGRIDNIENDIETQKGKTQTIETDIAEQKQKTTALETKMDKAQNDITALENKYNALPNDLMNRFNALWDSYNALADRVAALENK